MGHYGRWLDGSGVYEGDFYNGAIHGYGRMIYFNGSYYQGEWKNGYQHGRGKFVCYGASYSTCNLRCNYYAYSRNKGKNKEDTFYQEKEGEWLNGSFYTNIPTNKRIKIK